jgi:hypothetical protein
MSNDRSNPNTKNEYTNSGWPGLYRLGGVVALVASLLYLSDIAVMLSGISLDMPTGEWFALMRSDRFAGIVHLFFSDLAGLLLSIPFVLGLYLALRRTNAAYAGLAAVAAFVGISAILGSNQNYTLVVLSDRFAVAASEAQQAGILSAAEALASTAVWSTGFLVGATLIEAALTMLSMLMLHNSSFGKGLAWLGIAAHGLDCLHDVILLALVPVLGADRAMAIAAPLLVVGGTLQLAWYPWAAIRLLKLSASARGEAAKAES